MSSRLALPPTTLEDAMDDALTFGRPYLIMTGDGKWLAWIVFNTTPGTRLDATSAHLDTPLAALLDAVNKARAIRAAFKD